MTTIIVTDPGHDIATAHMSYWVKVIADYIRAQKDMQVLHLKGMDVSHENLKKRIEETNPSLLLLNGHGGDDHIAGYNNEVLIACGSSSVGLCSGRCIHSIACQAGRRLGKDLIAAGATAFIGYQEKFHFLHTSDHPLQSHEHDGVADLFLEPAYAVPRALAGGENTQQAYDNAQAMFKANLSKILATHDSSATQLATHLYHDLKHHVLLGDPLATI